MQVGTPKVENGTYRVAEGTPAGYDANTNNPFVAGGYIAAIGRDEQLPPIVADLESQAKASGAKVQVEPLFDDDRQYIGYRAAVVLGDKTVASVDVTGAASRSLPKHLVDSERYVVELAMYEAASDHDAPPESGNFDGGFVASATQAARYAHDARREREKVQQ